MKLDTLKGHLIRARRRKRNVAGGDVDRVEHRSVVYGFHGRGGIARGLALERITSVNARDW
jgi:hypothetical protein